MPAPMIGDLELKAVQWIRQEANQDFVRQRVAGLEGTLHQKLGRRSHRVTLVGVLLPDTATDDLQKLQEMAAAGDEITFTADITTALEIDKMVIESLVAEQRVGPAGQIAYRLTLAESPPLPPPAELSSFGGLGDFGLGNLGFDPGGLGDVLGDITDQAGSIMDSLDSALDAIDQISALASMADLGDVGSLLRPVADRVGELGQVAPAVQGLQGLLGGLIGSP